MDYKLSQKYVNALNALGFKMEKDVLGWYFTRTTYKFSIMKNGPHYLCYYNMNRGNQWVLVNRSPIMIDFVQALHWIYEIANKLV